MDVESAHDARREREAAEKRKKEIDEVIELALLALVFFSLVGVILYFSFGIMEQRG
jgi:ribonuclease PH